MAYSRTLNHFTSMQELATIWASSTSYVVNQLVIESDKLYRCLVAHTSSGTFIADLQAARWVEISASEAGVFNYIGNPDAEVDASGWTTYAESDSVTFTDAGDLVTLNNHGLSNGNEISFTSITSTTGISVNTRYFVVSATTNTFQVASSSGGSALPLTTNGSGTMVRFVPKTGSGGSPNITWSRSIASPLRGDADFNLVKDAANRQGQGVEYDFTIDNADLAKVLTVTFDYEVVSGTLATGDVTVYLIQDPSGTPLVIQPAGYQVQSATVGTKMRQIATFQTSSTVTSYRLCLHVSSVSASAYTLAVDNVVVGPQVVQYGAPVTDWQSYTPTTQGFGTVANMVASYRRVGGNLEVQFYFEAGTPTATEARLGLPTGLTITGVSSVGNSPTAVGYFNTNGPASSSGDIGAVNNNNYVVFNTLNNLRTNANGNGITVAGTGVSANFSVPILGWSSTVQMSNDTDTRVVAAKYTGLVSAAISATQPLQYNTKEIDTHNAVTTGTSWKFTAPVPGIYEVSVLASSTASSSNTFLYKNGVQGSIILTINSTNNDCGSAIVELNAGDFIDVRPNVGLTANTLGQGHISIRRLSGPSAIAASETVAARYTGVPTGTTAGTFAAAGSVTYPTRTFDTHGMVSGANINIPVAGKYKLYAKLQLNCATSSNDGFAGLAVYVDGVIYSTHLVKTAASFTTVYPTISESMNLNAGQVVTIRCATNVTTPVFSDALSATLAIERIGN